MKSPMTLISTTMLAAFAAQPALAHAVNQTHVHVGNASITTLPGWIVAAASGAVFASLAAVAMRREKAASAQRAKR